MKHLCLDRFAAEIEVMEPDESCFEIGDTEAGVMFAKSRCVVIFSGLASPSGECLSQPYAKIKKLRSQILPKRRKRKRYDRGLFRSLNDANGRLGRNDAPEGDSGIFKQGFEFGFPAFASTGHHHHISSGKSRHY
jgi:hypothetical protein